MAGWTHQGIINLNNLKFLFIPSGEKLFIGHCYVDGIICNKLDYTKNIQKIKTINKGIEKELITIFLDELDTPLNYK